MKPVGYARRLVFILAMHSLFVAVLVGLTVRSAQSAECGKGLIDRGLFDADGVPGGAKVRLVYHVGFDITWLGDANFAQNSGVAANGWMTWRTAVNWADSLTVGGYTDWRLPTTTQPDPSCSLQEAVGGSGENCTGSEMGHLFYCELGGTAGSSILRSADPDLDLFNLNMTLDEAFWSGTESAWDTNGAWTFDFYSGGQGYIYKTRLRYAWAVRDGDISLTECSDGKDNDGDGQIDYPDDTRCSSPYYPSESRFCWGRPGKYYWCLGSRWTWWWIILPIGAVLGSWWFWRKRRKRT